MMATWLIVTGAAGLFVLIGLALRPSRRRSPWNGYGSYPYLHSGGGDSSGDWSGADCSDGSAGGDGGGGD